MQLLGHVISANGIQVDPTKVKAILSWERPKSVTDIMSFLGLAGYYRKFSKCEFWVLEVRFLGHVVLEHGIQVDPTKVEVVVNWRRSSSVTDIRSFLGLVGYYRKFIQGFPSLVLPLTRLTRKGAPFIWDDSYE